ncbi:Crp/Fnr family transcriptional regulator [Flammeovirga sp. OC4]|uniref:Crp/Fnr family transcriptional regulator n=1 Tax=Flammeovirga sp. OC4 TaxID=1382345 RepID=UPI0005C5707D|nr:Crp/Fnr family transcriptional regulator [Flammeovirga sp. OC4]
MQNLLNTIETKIKLTPVLKTALETSFQKVMIQKGTVILEEDTTARFLYFIDKGVLHNYYYHDGKQISSWFYTENHFITAWYSFYAQQPSFEAIECLEDCELYRISYTDYQKLIKDFPEFNTFARLLSEEMLMIIDQISKNWSFLTAKQKYEVLQSYFPQIELRVKLGLIASFLGISQETLSRLRAQK